MPDSMVDHQPGSEANRNLNTFRGAFSAWKDADYDRTDPAYRAIRERVVEARNIGIIQIADHEIGKTLNQNRLDNYATAFIQTTNDLRQNAEGIEEGVHRVARDRIPPNLDGIVEEYIRSAAEYMEWRAEEDLINLQQRLGLTPARENIEKLERSARELERVHSWWALEEASAPQVDNQETKEQDLRNKNELARRIGRDGMEAMTDQRLIALVDAVGHQRNSGMLQAEDIRQYFLDLVKEQAKNPKIYDQQELDMVQKALQEWYKELKDFENQLAKLSQQTNVAGTGMDPETFGDVLSHAIYGERLSKDEKYAELLRDEEWNNKELVISFESPPQFYIDYTLREREEFKNRQELGKIALFKRGRLAPPGLDTLSKYPEWAGFTKSETEALMQIPGVEQAMQIYVQWATESEDFRTAKGRKELSTFRTAIREQIADQVREGWHDRYRETENDENLSEEERAKDLTKLSARGLAPNADMNDRRVKMTIDFKCRDAEQIAFNLLYAGNAFESLDTEWKDGRRVRNSQISSDVVHPVIKEQMKPMDSVVNSFTKKPESTTWVGKFGEWAYLNMIEDNGGKPLSKDEDYNVTIVPDSNPRDFWTRSGNTLYVPECYPVELVGSFWDETRAETRAGKESLMDKLKKGEHIDWDDVDAQTAWGAYSSKMGKAGKLWEVFQGKVSLKSDLRSMDEWKNDVDNALGKFGRRNEKSIKRWLIYASVGVQPRKEWPRLASPALRGSIRGTLGPRELNYLDWKDLLFSWDQPL